MPTNKPGVPWPEIETRVRAGEGYREIERDLKTRDIKISHEAISRRARRKGWVTSAEHWERQAKRLGSIQKLTNPQTTGDKIAAARSLKSPDMIGAILAGVQSGASETTAAGAAGIDISTWKAWKAADQELAQLTLKARRASLMGAEHQIAQAGERGDWRASLTRLERAPETRDDWAPSKGGSGEGGIKVIINIDRGGREPMIDVSPE